jgi:D-glucosaminate-6-phosphate ammonia-lyase
MIPRPAINDNRMSIYRNLGVEPIINATGTVTRLGGAVLPEAVLKALEAGARETVPLDVLHDAASRRISKVTGAEAGLVTAGAAAALTLGTAAILAGDDLARMERLPDTRGMRNEFIVAREQRNGYDHAVRAAGAHLVEVGFNEIIAGAGVRRTEAWEYEAAITERTAGILYVFNRQSRPALVELVEVAQHHRLPVLVDAAGGLPPRSNLTALIDAGADLVCYSGGKAIRGPQGTGILCGRRELVSAAALQMLDMDDHPELWDPPSFIERPQRGLPRHGIGRGFKVGKEQIVALLTALELFASGAYVAEIAAMTERLRAVEAALKGAMCVCRLVPGATADHWALLEIAVDETSLGRTAFDVCRALRSGSPPVYIGHGKLAEGVLVVNPVCVADSQWDALDRRLREELR